jgi:methylated-DNA-protein-cysteine methyltransferase-like protein
MPKGQNLYFRIYNVVRRIPKGKVATYGQIAALANAPRASQVVGWALRNKAANSKMPWHRVINREGMISIENFNAPKEMQVKLLRDEDIEVEEREGNFWVDLKKFGWDGKV